MVNRKPFIEFWAKIKLHWRQKSVEFALKIYFNLLKIYFILNTLESIFSNTDTATPTQEELRDAVSCAKCEDYTKTNKTIEVALSPDIINGWASGFNGVESLW